jgi:hypothetical protein
MPIDSILVSAAVVSVFVVFAGVLIWGDFQSRPMRQQPVARNRKHAASNHTYCRATGPRTAFG